MKKKIPPDIHLPQSCTRGRAYPSLLRVVLPIVVASLSAPLVIACSQENGVTDGEEDRLHESTASKSTTADHPPNDEEVPATDPKATQVVEQALEAHGSRKLIDREVAFTFRDSRFRFVKRSDGRFRYERTFTNDDHQTVHDVLTNEGTERYIDGKLTTFKDDEERTNVSEAVNSVVYFTTLPLSLTDDAVRLSDGGQETIDGEDYDRVEVRFVQEGGGADHDDVFVYWFHAETHTLDYLAYSYSRDDGGMRFRVAKNRVRHAGVVFQDYDNYSPESLQTSVISLNNLYQQGSLCGLSVVENSEICIAKLDSEEGCD